VAKYCRAGQPTDGNMAHAHCVLDTYGYKYTLRLCNIYCFSTITTVALSPLNVTLYIKNLKNYEHTKYQPTTVKRLIKYKIINKYQPEPAQVGTPNLKSKIK
jgi:hypothetical protein